jgi:hypothetical protein
MRIPCPQTTAANPRAIRPLTADRGASTGASVRADTVSVPLNGVSCEKPGVASDPAYSLSGGGVAVGGINWAVFTLGSDRPWVPRVLATGDGRGGPAPAAGYEGSRVDVPPGIASGQSTGQGLERHASRSRGLGGTGAAGSVVGPARRRGTARSRHRGQRPRWPRAIQNPRRHGASRPPSASTGLASGPAVLNPRTAAGSDVRERRG